MRCWEGIERRAHPHGVEGGRADTIAAAELVVISRAPVLHYWAAGRDGRAVAADRLPPRDRALT